MFRRVPLVIGVVVALVIGLSACVFGGNAVSEHETAEVDLVNQRKVALAFLEMHPGTSQIRFTQDGGPSGFGAPWAANAVIRIDGEDYQAILGIGILSSDPLPSVPLGATPEPTTIVYSDGSSEVIQ